MRRLLSFFLLLPFLLSLPSCQKGDAAITPIGAAAERVQSVLGGKSAFVEADADFIETNLGAPSYLAEGGVFFSESEKNREFGLFRLNDRTHAEEFKESVRRYLAGEYEALRSLSALYPAEELEERLSLYRDATVGSEGMLVYYFVMSKPDKDKAIEALTMR